MTTIERGGLGTDGEDDEPARLLGDEPPERRPGAALAPVPATGADVQRHDVLDGEIVHLPPRPPIEMRARPVAVPKPWDEPAPERRPIVAEWLRDAEQRRKAVTWWAKGRAYSLGYHAVRLPIYAALHVAYAPRGAYRCYERTRDWVNDADSKRLRDAARERADDANYQKYRTIMERTRAERLIPARLAWGAILAALATINALYWLPAEPIAPWWLYWPTMLALVAALGRTGQRPDRPIFTPAVVPNAYRKLSPGVVLRAFEVAKLSTEKEPVTFATGLHRDSNGYAVVLDLPYGKTAEKAIADRDVIASGLDVDERQLFLTRVRGVSGSARRVHMWVCDVDPLSIPAGRTPLLDVERVNYWRPWPFGRNERGEVVELCMLWQAMLIGAKPRRGKTFVARLPTLAAVLDPGVRILIWDFKGSPDWTPFKLVANRHFQGYRPDPETGVCPVFALLETVRELLDEVDRRNRVLRSLPQEVCPEGKLTEELARNKSFNMPLVLLVIDEVQRGFEHKTYGDDLAEACADLAKVGPSVGIMQVSATQKPDSKSTPTSWRDQFGVRFGLYVTTRDASEAVLGAGAGAEGLHCHKLPPTDESRGTGILRGTGDEKVNGGLVRTFLADGVDTLKICERGRKLRDDAGTLDGMALGHVVSATPVTHSVAEDLAVVLGADEQTHSDVLCARLAQSWPDRYGGWQPAQLAAALKPHGVRTRQVWAESLDGDMRNRQGVKRAELLAALTPQDDGEPRT